MTLTEDYAVGGSVNFVTQILAPNPGLQRYLSAREFPLHKKTIADKEGRLVLVVGELYSVSLASVNIWPQF